MVISTIGSSCGAFFFKKASGQSFRPVALIQNRYFIVGITTYAVSAVLSVIAFRGGELTVLVPLASLNYIWTAILAQRFLGERMNFWKWIGILFIFIGLAFVGLGDKLWV